MTAWWSGTGHSVLQTPQTAIVNALAHRLVENHRTNHDTQLRAWHAEVAILRDVVTRFPNWHVLLEYPLLRLGRRIDAVLLADRAIIVLEFKVGATAIAQADRMQVEDYALDLVDFHAGSRRHPVIPVLVATEATPRPSTPSFAFEGMATQVIDASAATLADTLADIVTRIAPPAAPLDGPTWDAAAYRPVPTIIEAATMRGVLPKTASTAGCLLCQNLAGGRCTMTYAMKAAKTRAANPAQTQRRSRA